MLIGAPTVMMKGSFAGAAVMVSIGSDVPLLPAEATTTMPLNHRISAAAFIGLSW
jgi:hypothetical protein